MSQQVDQPGGTPLDWPVSGIGPVAAVKRGFSKYAVFNGRASRSEFWWWYAFYVVGVTLLVTLGAAIGAATAPAGSDSFGTPGIVIFVLAGVFFLAIIVPTLAVGARRLHDAGFTALFLLFLLASSFGGGLVLLVLWLLPTSPKAVRFGPPGQPSDLGQGYGQFYPQPGQLQPGQPYPADQGYPTAAGYPGPQGGYPDPQGYPGQQGYDPQGYPGQQGYDPQGYPGQQGYDPQGYQGQQGYPGQPGQGESYPPAPERPRDASS